MAESARRPRQTGSQSIPRYDVGALWSRVDTLSDEVHGIRQSISSLHQKLDDRQKTPWAAIGAGIAFLAFISVFILYGFNAYVGAIRDAQDRTQIQIDRLTAVVVPRAELEDRREIANQRTERIEADLLRLQGNVYPREVHLERWSAFTAELNHIREEQSEQRDQFNQLYPTSNVLENVLQRIERLESRWIDRRMSPETNEPRPSALQ